MPLGVVVAASLPPPWVPPPVEPLLSPPPSVPSNVSVGVGTVFTSSEPTRAAHGMVVSQEATASKIGVDVLKAGGTAIDAASRVGDHGVAGDGKTGPGDIFLAQVRQSLLEFLAPFRIGTGNLLPGRAGLPDAQEPDPVESHPGNAIEFGVGNVIERGSPAHTSG